MEVAWSRSVAWLTRLIVNQEIAGSNPVGTATLLRSPGEVGGQAAVAQLVERLLPKEEVAGSKPVRRSTHCGNDRLKQSSVSLRIIVRLRRLKGRPAYRQAGHSLRMRSAALAQW
jgi:hypothetical protein